MFAPTLLNVFKTSLKSLYDIDPLVVDHMLLSARVQAKVAASLSADVFQQAEQVVRSHFTAQPLGAYA